MKLTIVVYGLGKSECGHSVAIPVSGDNKLTEWTFIRTGSGNLIYSAHILMLQTGHFLSDDITDNLPVFRF
jgi:hypothetical protein